MGNILICDNCKRVIKKEEEKYTFAIQRINEENQPRTNLEIMEYYRQAYNEIEAKVLCSDCKKILDYLFNTRREKLAKILLEIKSSYTCDKKTKYCKCGKKYQDRGLAIDGEMDGICYICGLPIKPLTKKELKELLEEEENEEI